jgi:D-alanyl-D-alanine carboxypeptidase
MFAQEFTKRGVAVQRWRVAGSADPVALGATVLPVLTTPIATVLRGANTESKNIYAEGLAKRMGAARASAILEEVQGAIALWPSFADEAGLSRRRSEEINGVLNGRKPAPRPSG